MLDKIHSLPKTKFVCLCGSTKYKKEYEQATLEWSLKGYIVLSVICFSHADNISLTEEQKVLADELHFQKISLADHIFVINPGGYVGSSTKNEIEFAKFLGKPISYLEEPVC